MEDARESKYITCNKLYTGCELKGIFLMHPSIVFLCNFECNKFRKRLLKVTASGERSTSNVQGYRSHVTN